MLIGSKQKKNTLHTSPSLEINGLPLNRVNYTTLGVLIDENLTWINHIQKDVFGYWSSATLFKTPL